MASLIKDKRRPSAPQAQTTNWIVASRGCQAFSSFRGWSPQEITSPAAGGPPCTLWPCLVLGSPILPGQLIGPRPQPTTCPRVPTPNPQVPTAAQAPINKKARRLKPSSTAATALHDAVTGFHSTPFAGRLIIGAGYTASLTAKQPSHTRLHGSSKLMVSNRYWGSREFSPSQEQIDIFGSSRASCTPGGHPQ